MVPVPIPARNSHTARLLYILLSLATNYVPRIFHRSHGDLSDSSNGLHSLVRRESKFNPHDPKSIVFAVLIPVLVLLSGLFAGLTLGYMSLDETQLHVLSISGTPEQRKYANKIMPVRKNGHLLLVTLLLANMIVNESLPVISDPVLGGGVQSVVVSTVLIVIFAEIIPQSLFTRHGLYLGAKMAGFTKCLIFLLSVIAWPVAKLLEWVLGPHHGIIYRRAELKELIAMHSSHATHGGDLKTDTVAIIGATLDLQEKVVKQAMTPIDKVFMLSIDSKLDYDLLKKICQTGHSRVPVYEEVDVPVSVVAGPDASVLGTTSTDEKNLKQQRTVRVKKIIGILLVKQCVLLDPKDATPLRKIPLNKVPFVPNNEPLLGILDKFQEGRSHMAIVSRFSVEKAASVKKAVKTGLTQRLRKRVGMGDSSDEETESSDEEGRGSSSSSSTSNEFALHPNDRATHTHHRGQSQEHTHTRTKKRWGRKRLMTMNGLIRKNSRDSESEGATVNSASILKEKEEVEAKGDNVAREGMHSTFDDRAFDYDVEKAAGGDDKVIITAEPPSSALSEKLGSGGAATATAGGKKNEEGRKSLGKITATALQLPKLSTGLLEQREQSMPADAVLAKEGAAEFLQGFDPAVMPLGIITLEDVLEELIGEEIYDEFDTQGAHGDPYEVPPPAHEADAGATGALHAHAGGDTNAHTNVNTTRLHAPVPAKTSSALAGQIGVPNALKGLGFFRTRSAPPVQRERGEVGNEAPNSATSSRPASGGSNAHAPSTTPNVNASANANKSVRIDDRSAVTPIQMPKPVRGTGRHPPSVILEQHSSVSSAESGTGLSFSSMPNASSPVGQAQLPTASSILASASGSAASPSSSGAVVHSTSPQQSLSVPSSSPPMPAATGTGAQVVPAPVPAIQVHKSDKPPSRSGSPAPPLEAILLDRKRRLAAASGGASGTATASPSPTPSGAQVNTPAIVLPLSASGVAPALGIGLGSSGGAAGGPLPSGAVSPRSGHGNLSAKGTRFKSSPLGGGERSGVVVAEQVGAAYSKPKEKEGEERIPSEMDKVGPDKA